MKIETTFTDGIKYLLETQDTQLAAANEATIKFYDFIDKREKEQEDDGTDNIQEQLDLEEFSWGNNQVFPRSLLVRR